MVQILAFQIDFCTAQIFSHPFGFVEKRRSAGVTVQQFRKLRTEFGFLLVIPISFFKLNNSVHQRLRNILPAVRTESSFFLCILTQSKPLPFLFVPGFSFHTCIADPGRTAKNANEFEKISYKSLPHAVICS